jgi:hypothetical protein
MNTPRSPVHQRVYRKGRAAARAGDRRIAPYGFETPWNERFRLWWLRGFDSVRVRKPTTGGTSNVDSDATDRRDGDDR